MRKNQKKVEDKQMIIIKYIFLGTIFASSCFIGILISKKYKSRVMELKQFKDATNILEAKIKFTYEPLGDIFKEISSIIGSESKINKIFEDTSVNMKNISVRESWEKAIDKSKNELNLNNEDINLIKGLGKMLRANRCARTNKRN